MIKLNRKEDNIMENIKYLDKDLRVIIDYPIGSNGNGFIYPVNYGHIQDNDKTINVYILGIYVPLHEFTGRCIAIIKGTDEDQLIISNQYYIDEQIEALIEFKESNDLHLIIRNSDIIDNGLIELADGLASSYDIEIKRLKKVLIKLIVNNIKEIDLIEHLLDSLLNIPTVSGERLYNYLCYYLEKINKESAKFYRLEYKNIWD